MVNHPAHYNKAGIETIDAIGAATNEGFKYYLQGNILKVHMEIRIQEWC